MCLNQKTEYYLADIGTLVPYARNARTHSPEQVAQIAASIREFGFLSPVVTTKDGTILCGHGRFYAAQKLGLKEDSLHPRGSSDRGAAARVHHRGQQALAQRGLG